MPADERTQAGRVMKGTSDSRSTGGAWRRVRPTPPGTAHRVRVELAMGRHQGVVGGLLDVDLEHEPPGSGAISAHGSQAGWWSSPETGCSAPGQVSHGPRVLVDRMGRVAFGRCRPCCSPPMPTGSTTRSRPRWPATGTSVYRVHAGVDVLPAIAEVEPDLVILDLQIGNNGRHGRPACRSATRRAWGASRSRP